MNRSVLSYCNDAETIKYLVNGVVGGHREELQKETP